MKLCKHDCIPCCDFCIYAKSLTSNVKVFPKWDDERYIIEGSVTGKVFGYIFDSD